jgi:hypothetical protein
LLQGIQGRWQDRPGTPKRFAHKRLMRGPPGVRELDQLHSRPNPNSHIP